MSVDPKKFGITPSLVDAVKLTLESKSLAALAPPRDKVTHKDVLVGRGVLKKHPQDPDKHVVAKEEAEQVDELSKKTLGSYATKAADSAATHTGAAAAYGSSSKHPDAAKMAQHQAKAAKRTVGLQKAVGKLTKEENVSETNGSSNPSTSSSALDKINSIATDMKKMASEPLKAPKDPGAVKKLPNVNAPGAPDMFKTEAVADPMATKKAEVQKKIAQKQATAVQARANKRMSNINASNDKCSCGSTNESKMKCEVHGGGMKGGKEKIEVNPPLREAEDLPKKVITKGHEIAKSLIKHRAKVREPYAVGMAQAKKSAGIKEAKMSDDDKASVALRATVAKHKLKDIAKSGAYKRPELINKLKKRVDAGKSIKEEADDVQEVSKDTLQRYSASAKPERLDPVKGSRRRAGMNLALKKILDRGAKVKAQGSSKKER